MDSAVQVARTAWGDAEGRHRDILASAEQILAESGYPALTMRAIAAGAGVSSGTVYQYFAGKEDVFAALMARRLDTLRDTLDALDRELGVAGVLREIVPQVTELWRRVGRSSPQWEAKVLAGRGGKGLVTSATVYRRTIQALARTLTEAAEANGQTLVGDPAVAFWVWDSLIGLADDLLHGGAAQGKVRSKRLVEFATAAIERGIIESR
ncbi:MAG TPA: TetR/AcrR family transcriptional regulator [Pseudonocardia sp.]|nr:TetR/AcrR family transcriptional regulator [Pseudonocardia sp.]